MDTLKLGIDYDTVRDLNDVLETMNQLQCDFASIPLFHPRFDRNDSAGAWKGRTGTWTRSDMIADSRVWGSHVIGKVTSLVDLDNPDASVRAAGEQILRQEWNWAVHLSIQAVLFPAPDRKHANYARFISQICHESSHLALWIRIPLVHPQEFCARLPTAEEAQPVDPWILWDQLRTLCDYHPRLGVALELTGDLPDHSAALARWQGEPVRALIIPTDIFLTNKKGYPCLSKAHQAFVIGMYKFHPKIVIKGKPRHMNAYLPYLQYLDYLRGQMPEMTEAERFTAPYRDYLQAPLQPLMDNLESQTYETFERDPIKYERYEAAIAAALKDKLDAMAANVQPVVVMVVGAGRGPLVKATLNASAHTNCPVRVFAVEKNPNAIITLSNRIQMERWTNVTLVACDMRYWEAPEKAEIMVSELLGSFGDNELSPECLDGAQRFLCPDTGISIPASYTSYLAPISSHKLWSAARSGASLPDGNGLETPYVVQLFNHWKITEEKPCFTFVHPLPATPAADNSHNERFTSLTFDIPASCTIHGFGGYFEAVLYKDVMISIAPGSFSTDMFSWFPIYFPIHHPLQLHFGPDQTEQLTVNFWRRTGSGKVWYEWCIVEPRSTPIENVGGRTYWIGL